MFIALCILAVVATCFVVGFTAYHAGRWTEREQWNEFLGLPERTPDRPHFSKRDIGTRPIGDNDVFQA